MLKKSTIKKYSNEQLLRSLDRKMSKRACPPYRVDHWGIRKLINGAYFPFCSSANRRLIIEVIESV